MAAAGELFSARGYEDVTIRDIRRRRRRRSGPGHQVFHRRRTICSSWSASPISSSLPRQVEPLTAQNVTRALVGRIEPGPGRPPCSTSPPWSGRGHGTPSGPDGDDAGPAPYGRGRLAPAGRVHIEAIAALVVGAGFMRYRMEAPGLRPLNARPSCTELLTPAVQALLDTARDRPSRWPPTAAGVRFTGPARTDPADETQQPGLGIRRRRVRSTRRRTGRSRG